jgi:hypothetical protein
LDQSWLKQVAEKLVGQVLAIKPGESVSILCDRESASGPVAEAVVQACEKAGTDPVCLVMKARSINGEELPEPIANEPGEM